VIFLPHFLADKVCKMVTESNNSRRSLIPFHKLRKMKTRLIRGRQRSVDKRPELVRNDHDEELRSMISRNSSDADSSAGSFRAPKRRTNVKPIVTALLGSITTGGTTYAFSVYSSELKRSLHLSQSELDTISASFFCAGLFSWLPGMISDIFGPKCGMILGSISMAVSLGSYYWIATTSSSAPHDFVVPTLSAIGVWMFLSCAAVTGSVFKLISVNCDDATGNKGVTVGTAKGYVGLGSGVYACLFESMKNILRSQGATISDLDFLPLAAFFAIVAACFPACCFLDAQTGGAFVSTMPAVKDVLRPWHFQIVHYGLLGLGVIVVGKSLLELQGNSNSNSVPQNAPFIEQEDIIVATLVLFFWFVPILSLLCVSHQNDTIDNEGQDSGEISFSSVHDSSLIPSGNLKVVAPSVEYDVEDSSNRDQEGEQLLSSKANSVSAHRQITRSRLPEQPNLSLAQMLRTSPAWFMLWTCTILAGAGTMITNNLGQMAEALRFPPSTATAALALFSAAQATGRVVTGSVSERALHNPALRLPRPVFLIASSIAACISHLILAMATSEAPFVIGVTLSGFAFGMIWPLMVLIVGECFGISHMGANYMFYDGTTSALGTLLLSKFVTQAVYESHIVHGGTPGNHGDDTTCYGHDCFYWSHLAVVGLSLTCVLSSLAMWRSTEHIYQ